MSQTLWTNLFITLRTLIITTTLASRRRINDFSNRVRFWRAYRRINIEPRFNEENQNVSANQEEDDNNFRRARRKLAQGLLSIGVIGLKLAAGLFSVLSLTTDDVNIDYE